MSVVALNTFLKPLQVYLDDESITEIMVNKPGELWIERSGQMVRFPAPELTYDRLHNIARLTAESVDQDITEVQPLLSATIPGGYRIQVVIPPACPVNTVILSIRRPNALQLTLTDYANLGAFTRVNGYTSDEALHYITQAVQNKKNILISGGTSSGKTTFLNACLLSIKVNERLLTIEDAAELRTTHTNMVNLFFSRGDQGVAKVTPVELLQSALRLRPDRIILGELRGAEAYVFLRAVNTGHPGSMTTLHADTPKRAIDQLALMVMQAGLGLNRTEIRQYVESIIDVVVQLKRDASGRYVSDIYEPIHE